MKKLLAIFTILFLTAAVSFAASLSIGGRAFCVAQVVGNSEKGVGEKVDEPWTNWNDDIRLLFMLNNDEGTAGAAFRLTGTVWKPINVNWFQAWWQPIPMLYFSMGKIQELRRYNPEPAKLEWGVVGINEASDMGFIQFVPWETYQGIGPHNDNIYAQLKAASDRVGMQLSVIPIEDVHVTFVWNGFETDPYTKDRASLQNVLLDKMGVNVSYTNPFGGQASFFFNNAVKGETKKIGLMYTQQILNPLYAEATMLLPLPDKGDIPFIGAGIGMSYKFSSQFKLNARAAAEISLIDVLEVYDAAGALMSGHNTKIGFDIAPSFEIDWSLKAHLHLGYAMDLDAELIGWSICPYIVKDAGWVSLWAGFKIWRENAGTFKKKNGDPSISWAVPVGMMLRY